MKINKEFILKNLMTIICGITIVALFLPFIGVSADVSVGGFGASTDETTFIGYTIVTEGGFLGILMELCIVIIIASAYLPQLKPYRKIACAASSLIGLICLFIVPNMISKSSSADAGGGISASVDVKTSLKFGFWLMLICYIALIAMSVIQFLGLKGNKVFDAINQGNNTEGDASTGAASEKLKSMAQNMSNAVGNIKDKIATRSEQQSQDAQQVQSIPQQPTQPVQQVQQVQTIPQAQTNANVAAAAGSSNAVPVAKGDPEETMKYIKELHAMKEAGILTEEEFNEKKQEFLKKI